MIQAQKYDRLGCKVVWQAVESPNGYRLVVRKKGHEISMHLKQRPTAEKVDEVVGELKLWIEENKDGVVHDEH